MKRILVAIDFSEVTPPVIQFARQLAKTLAAEIHLVHVREITAAPMPGSLGYGLAGMPELAPMTRRARCRIRADARSHCGK